MLGLFSRLCFWSLIAMKQLLSLLICKPFGVSAYENAFTLCWFCLLFLKNLFWLYAKAFFKSFLCPSLLRHHKLAVLSGNVFVLYYELFWICYFLQEISAFSILPLRECFITLSVYRDFFKRSCMGINSLSWWEILLIFIAWLKDTYF